jgi:hypothetical protein
VNSAVTTGRPSSLGWAIAAGALLGAVYTLSPLTVLVLGMLPMLWSWSSRGLSQRERHWLAVVLVVAVAARLLAIAALFLSAPHAVPYANFFGDEELFKRRSIWLRNIGLGVPISGADFIYAYDDVGFSSHLYILAYLQAVIGAAPYGILVLDAALYIGGALALYRLVRPAYGGLASLGGLTLLLLLPSLFTWSITALKEPLYMCVGAIEVVAAANIVRQRGIWRKVLSAVVAVACGAVLQGLREGGLLMLAIGAGGGLAVAVLVSRPRLFLTALVALPLAIFIAFNRPAVQLRVWSAVQAAAYKHWGQVVTPGYTYKLFDPELYPEKSSMNSMTPAQAERFVLRAAAAYVVVPAPWQIESRTALAYLPEQVLWYLLCLFAPIGIWVGLRRDAVITSLLVCHAATAALMVALSGGNVGTLVRHRGLALPFVVWLSALGAVEVGLWLAARGAARVDTGAALSSEVW